MNDNVPPPPIGMALRHAHLRAARRFAEQLRPLGLDNAHAGILLHLGFLGPQTQRALMDLLGQDKSAMVRNLDALEARGLVRREPHPTDRRAHAVAVTEAGREQLDAVLGAVRRTEAELTDCFTPEESELFHTLLLRFNGFTGYGEGVTSPTTENGGTGPRPAPPS